MSSCEQKHWVETMNSAAWVAAKDGQWVKVVDGPKRCAYNLIKRFIREGDILLFHRGPGLFNRIIAISGRSEYIHAGMVIRDGYFGKDWNCLSTVQNLGGVSEPLADLVKQYPGRFLVRSPAPGLKEQYDGHRAALAMLATVHKPYGWGALLKASLIHLPVVRVFVWRYLLPFMVHDDTNGSLPFCSMAVSRACRAGGIDPVPNLGDQWTEPGDLYRSAAFVDKWILM